MSNIVCRCNHHKIINKSDTHMLVTFFLPETTSLPHLLSNNLQGIQYLLWEFFDHNRFSYLTQKHSLCKE